MESGFSFSILLSTFKGDGYIDGTKGAGANYFIGLGYEINEKHNLQFLHYLLSLSLHYRNMLHNL